MKKYVRTVMSIMVTGLFLMMAVASLDPEEDLDAPKDCEFLMTPQARTTVITVLVKDSETKLPMENVRIKLFIYNYEKERRIDNTECYFNHAGVDLPQPILTDNNGMITYNFTRNYKSEEDYSSCTFFVDQHNYYDVESNIIINFNKATVFEPFFLLKINSSP